MPSAASLMPALFVVLWATGFVSARYAMPWAEPFSFLAARFALAGVLLAALALLVGEWRLTRAQALHSAVAGALMHGVYLGAVFWAIGHGMPAGFSALIVGLQPLLTVLIGGRLLGERATGRLWLGLAVGFAGVAMVLAPRLGLHGVTGWTLGASFLAVLGMSAGTVWQKRWCAGAPLVAGAAMQFAAATALTLVLALMTETGTYVLTGELVFAMAWSVLVLSVGAIGLLMVMIREGRMSRVASLFYLVPGTTALMAWPLFGESLSPFQIAGMVVAAAGVALSSAGPARREG